jgi:hypothetical protein
MFLLPNYAKLNNRYGIKLASGKETDNETPNYRLRHNYVYSRLAVIHLFSY